MSLCRTWQPGNVVLLFKRQVRPLSAFHQRHCQVLVWEALQDNNFEPGHFQLATWQCRFSWERKTISQQVIFVHFFIEGTPFSLLLQLGLLLDDSLL